MKRQNWSNWLKMFQSHCPPGFNTEVGLVKVGDQYFAAYRDRGVYLKATINIHKYLESEFNPEESE